MKQLLALEARDEAITAVGNHYSEWVNHAVAIINIISLNTHDFTTDDIWPSSRS